MALTYLPRPVSQCLRGLGPCSHHRHHLVCRWLSVLPLVYCDRANLKALRRHGSAPLAYQHDRRLLCASDRWTKALLWWCADQTLQAFPPPEEGLRSLVADSPLAGTRGPTQPGAQHTRRSYDHPDAFGCRLVLLRATWGVYRLPVEVARLRREGDAA